jgi:Cu(I)/Ag(I) efflux system protein CusF
MEKNGFSARVHEDGNTDARDRLKVPIALCSGHTALVQGYAIEGYVPATDVVRLLKERPRAVGLAVPGMLFGSPGMDGTAYGKRKDAFDVLLIDADGRSSAFFPLSHQPKGIDMKFAQPLLLAVASSLTSLAWAAGDHGGAHMVQAQAAAPATAAAEMTDAEVRKVDKEGGKLTLKHGEIKNLEMPGMTMVFGVKDKAMLDTVKAGDKIKFKAINEAGKFTVTEMQMAR